MCMLNIETFIYGIHVYLMEPHIWRSDVSGSMSSFKVKGHMYMQEKSPILILGHNFWTSRERGFIFCMHMYFMELQELSGRMSRSRSSQKVKGQSYRSKQTTFKLLHMETLYVACKFYLIQQYMLIGDVSRLRSPFKVIFITSHYF